MKKILGIAAVVLGVVLMASLITAVMERHRKESLAAQDEVSAQWQTSAPLEPQPRTQMKVIYHDNSAPPPSPAQK